MGGTRLLPSFYSPLYTPESILCFTAVIAALANLFLLFSASFHPDWEISGGKNKQNICPAYQQRDNCTQWDKPIPWILPKAGKNSSLPEALYGMTSKLEVTLSHLILMPFRDPDVPSLQQVAELELAEVLVSLSKQEPCLNSRWSPAIPCGTQQPLQSPFLLWRKMDRVPLPGQTSPPLREIPSGKYWKTKHN